MISIKNLSFSYDNRNTIFDDFSLDIKSNEKVAILGPNGCGKSTLLRCILNLEEIKGSIDIMGHTPSEAINKRIIGFTFQSPILFDHLTLKRNISFPLHVGRSTRKYRREKGKNVDKLLKLTDLEDYSNYYPRQLSGGMAAKASLAMALVRDPKILLLDEPFSTIDMMSRTRLSLHLNEMIKNLNITSILITHSFEEAVLFADRIIILTNKPCKIKKIIVNDVKNKSNIESLDNPDFVKMVSRLRKELLY